MKECVTDHTTQIKYPLLKKILSEYINNNRKVFFDLFSGPGFWKKNKIDGSPLIANNILPNKNSFFVFVEKDKKIFTQLEKNTEKIKNKKVFNKNSTSKRLLASLIDEFKDDDEGLIFIDPCGHVEWTNLVDFLSYAPKEVDILIHLTLKGYNRHYSSFPFQNMFMNIGKEKQYIKFVEGYNNWCFIFLTNSTNKSFIQENGFLDFNFRKVMLALTSLKGERVMKKYGKGIGKGKTYTEKEKMEILQLRKDYSLKRVIEMTGVSASTMHYWKKKFSDTTPKPRPKKAKVTECTSVITPDSSAFLSHAKEQVKHWTGIINNLTALGVK